MKEVLFSYSIYMGESEIYGRELVDLRNQSRWEFLNTFFSVSEAVAYAQVYYENYFAEYCWFMLTTICFFIYNL